ncbi:MAG: hypothetical protein HDQ88_09310 [Clostridia bacterium]|nr:hypothetical protein [Clostridia bacterium]
MNLVTGIITATGIWVGVIAMLILLGKHKPKQVANRAVKYGGCAMTLLYCTAVFLMLMIYGRSYTHGNRDVWMSFSEMESCVRQSPVEDKLPANLSDVAVIFYRFDCKDCHATFEDLDKVFGDRNDVYFICTRSEQGKELLKRDDGRYKVPEVPYAVYVPSDPNEEPTKLVMYEKINDRIVINSDNVNHVLNLLDQEQVQERE